MGKEINIARRKVSMLMNKDKQSSMNLRKLSDFPGGVDLENEYTRALRQSILKQNRYISLFQQTFLLLFIA